MSKPTLFFIVGTRPEAIKMAPVVLEFRRYPELCDSLLISTGQHREDPVQIAGDFRPEAG